MPGREWFEQSRTLWEHMQTGKLQLVQITRAEFSKDRMAGRYVGKKKRSKTSLVIPKSLGFIL